MLKWLVETALGRLVQTGSLSVILPDETRVTMGDGTGEPVEARLADRRAVLSLLLQPELRTGELFTDGRLVMVQGTIYDFLCLVLSQPQERASGSARAIERIRQTISLWGQRNDPGRSRRNVAHHYDLGDAFYSLFLDPDWQYSCAYFEHPGQSLPDAQLAKKRHIAAKMVLHQVIVVNVILLVNTRYLGVRYRSLLLSQVAIPIAFGICALTASAGLRMLTAAPITAFLLSGLCYSALVIGLAWTWPKAVGFDRADLTHVLDRLRRKA